MNRRSTEGDEGAEVRITAFVWDAGVVVDIDSGGIGTRRPDTTFIVLTGGLISLLRMKRRRA